MLGGFILTFLGAGIFDIAGGQPLTPLQILWVNFAVDVLLAIGLGFDAAVPGLMKRKPRDAERADRRSRARDSAGRSSAWSWPRSRSPWSPGERIATSLAVATTMGLTALSLMHIVAALEAREPTGTIFKRYTIENRRLVQLVGMALALTFLVTALSPLQRIFDTVPLTSSQWGICLLATLAFLALRRARQALRAALRPGRARRG